MTKKIASIGVPGYDIRIAEKHEWFDNLLEGYCTLDRQATVPVTNYFSNSPVATLHKKEWLLPDNMNSGKLIDNLKRYGWAEEEPQESTYYTKIFTHSDHWGHEIVVMLARGVCYVTNRFAVELNHE